MSRRTAWQVVMAGAYVAAGSVIEAHGWLWAIPCLLVAGIAGSLYESAVEESVRARVRPHLEEIRRLLRNAKKGAA